MRVRVEADGLFSWCSSIWISPVSGRSGPLIALLCASGRSDSAVLASMFILHWRQRPGCLLGRRAIIPCPIPIWWRRNLDRPPLCGMGLRRGRLMDHRGHFRGWRRWFRRASGTCVSHWGYASSGYGTRDVSTCQATRTGRVRMWTWQWFRHSPCFWLLTLVLTWALP